MPLAAGSLAGRQFAEGGCALVFPGIASSHITAGLAERASDGCAPHCGWDGMLPTKHGWGTGAGGRTDAAPPPENILAVDDTPAPIVSHRIESRAGKPQTGPHRHCDGGWANERANERRNRNTEDRIQGRGYLASRPAT